MTNVLDGFNLQGRVALVTGGAQGLGQVMASALAQVGADIAVAARSGEACERAAAELAASTGRRARGYSADVTSSADLERLVDRVEADLGGIDVLINSAGINVRGASHELAESDWDAVIDTNLKGTFLASRTVGPRLVKRGWGRVINMGSILSVIGLPGRAPYAAAKAGVLNLTRVLALEWAGTGVTCNAICPGPFATEMNRSLLNDPVKYQEFIKQIPMGRWGELGEIAGAAVFLAAPSSSFITGSALFVDGGWTAR